MAIKVKADPPTRHLLIDWDLACHNWATMTVSSSFFMRQSEPCLQIGQRNLKLWPRISALCSGNLTFNESTEFDSGQQQT